MAVAVQRAAAVGIPPALVSLPMVAFGTSRPELAACVVAARRGESAIARGNVVGADLVNLPSALGVAAVVRATRAAGDCRRHGGVAPRGWAG